MARLAQFITGLILRILSLHIHRGTFMGAPWIMQRVTRDKGDGTKESSGDFSIISEAFKKSRTLKSSSFYSPTK